MKQGQRPPAAGNGSVRPASSIPLLIAHRAGNTIESAKAAAAAGADVIEADVWMYRGRLEVRHAKTMPLLPLLWDRWSIEPGWRPRLHLDELLASVPSRVELMLDLKGNNPRLTDAILRAVHEARREGHIAVCSRDWAQVDAFAGREGITAIHSVGRAGHLRALRRHLPAHGARRDAGISIHRRLLDAATVAELRALATPVVSWPVNDRATAELLAGWGIDGLISDRLELVRELAAGRAPATRPSSTS